jgi:hypothetical protein
MSLPSYDENQLSCVLRTCPSCRRQFYMRPPATVCVECSGWKPVPKKGTLFDGDRRNDVSGNGIFGP